MHQEHQQRPQQQQGRRDTYQPPEGDPRKPGPRGLEEWQSSIDRAIDDAIREGQFDNLPGHGKPLRIKTNPFNPEFDTAYSQLKNAGYAPTWMELDREITRRREGLEQSLQRSTVYLQNLITQLGSTTDPPGEPVITTAAAIPWWNIAARLRYLFAPSMEPTSRLRNRPLTRTDIVRIRENTRNQYLERAAELDKKIQQFHTALPRNLWHLERMSLPPERAMRQFDEAIPPIVSG